MGSNAVGGVSKDKKPIKVQELDELVVVGKVQKPRVYMIIGRGDLKPDEFKLERDWGKELEETLKGKPF